MGTAQNKTNENNGAANQTWAFLPLILLHQRSLRKFFKCSKQCLTMCVLDVPGMQFIIEAIFLKVYDLDKEYTGTFYTTKGHDRVTSINTGCRSRKTGNL